MAQAIPLHRDDPSKEPLVGNIKVTRQDWLNVAKDILISNGVEQVKVLPMSERLGVSRSSFYWYFKSRADLLDALLDHWEQTNTAALIAKANTPSDTINQSVNFVFHCVVNEKLFSIPFDFAVRDWARRSEKVRKVLHASEETRIDAIKAMFERHGYEEMEALTRARILYYMQNGYNDADLREPLEQRMKMVPHYLFGFTGKHATQEEIDDFAAYCEAVQSGENP